MLCKFSVLFLYVSVSQPTLSTSRSAQELGQRNPTLLRTSQTDWLRTLIGGPPSFSSFSLFLLLHLPSFLPSSSSSSSSLTFPCDFWLFGSFSICHTLSQRFSLAFLLVQFSPPKIWPRVCDGERETFGFLMLLLLGKRKKRQSEIGAADHSEMVIIHKRERHPTPRPL